MPILQKAEKLYVQNLRFAATCALTDKGLCCIIHTNISVSYTHLDVYKRQGVIPMGYLDMGAGRLVLTAEGIQDPPPEPEKEAQPPKGMEREEAVLTEIREVNDAIADAVMSAKIDHIGEITSKIFVYLREKPDKEGQLRSFLSYYLPTTLKILRAYAQKMCIRDRRPGDSLW